MAAQLSVAGRLQVNTALSVMDSLAEHLDRLRQRIVATARQVAGARALMDAIYGVGPMTSLALVCWLGGADRRVPAHLGVDEKAAGAGQDYLTVVSNLDTGTVEHIADERRKASLDDYFTQSSPDQRERIRAVAMDMWQPYITSVREHLTDPDSKIVFDRFHVMRYLTTAVDTVRKREHRALAAAGDTRLVGSKYLWLYSAQNLPAHHTDRFAALRTVDLKTSRAWAIKESLRHLWHYHRRGWGAKHWRRWYFWAPTPACNQSSTPRTPSNVTRPGCCPTSPTGSPTPARKASTPVSKPSAWPPEATATGTTSRPPSTSTAVDYSSTPQQSATEFPDEPEMGCDPEGIGAGGRPGAYNSTPSWPTGSMSWPGS